MYGCWARFSLALLVSSGGCEPVPAAKPAALEPCSLPGGSAAECGTVTVAEDPRADGGRSIELAVARVRARKPKGRPPVVFIAGGPGQGSRAAYGAALASLDALRDAHDLVFFDQRGTGDSGALRCPPEPELDLKKMLALEVDPQALSACRDALDADLTHYTTAHAVEDLVVVLDHLGYARAHLVGGSYGTRVVLAFARAHPDRTATIVIDGAAPPDFTMPLSFAADAQAALDALVADCGADPACHAAFPDLGAQLAELLARPEQPVAVEHPRTGRVETLALSGRDLAVGMRGALYVPELAALLPLAIDAASRGDYGPLVAQSALLGDQMAAGLAEGMFLSVVCAEDVPFITEDAVLRETAGTPIGRVLVDHLRASCQGWPQAELPPGFREPVVSDVPALVLSGALDPVTPPRWGEHVLRTLSSGRHVVVPGAGHGIVALRGADAVLGAFFAAGDAHAVDPSRLQARARPPFFIDFAGPAAHL